MAHSCQPGRTKAYNEDLRWRMVWQREVLGLKLKEVAKNLCVDLSTVHRITKLFYNTGSVLKRPYPSDKRPNKKVTDAVKIFILSTIVNEPHLYLRELKDRVLVFTGFEISPTVLCGYLRDMNFSRQKMKIIAKQRDEEIRSTFRSDVSLYKAHMLVFIDEAGSDRRDSLRRYGYNLRGQTPRSFKMLVRGERLSVIGIMTINGILDFHVVNGTSDGDSFLEFVENYLLPCLMPFNGTNPNSIVILDNCAIHHIEPVTNLINSVGAMIHYLPPYSPDYNPIEWCFSKVKRAISSMELEMQITEDIELIVRTAFATVTGDNCESWIKDCGIYNMD